MVKREEKLIVDIISFTHCYPEARAWLLFYSSRVQTFIELMGMNSTYVDLMHD